MPSPVNQTASNIAPANNSFLPPGFGEDMLIGGGPAALLYIIADAQIKIYNQLQDLYKKVALQETLVQKDTITAGAKAQRDAGALQAWNIGFQAGEAFAGVAVTGIAAAYEKVSGEGMAKNLKPLEEKMGSLEQLSTHCKGPADLARLPAQIREAPQAASDLTEKVNRLKAGAYNDSVEQDINTIHELKHSIETGRNPLETMRDKADLAAIEGKLGDRMADVNTRKNTIATNYEKERAMRSQLSSIATSMTGGGFKGGEAYFTAEAAQQQAFKDIDAGVQAMAAGVGGSAGQAQAGAFDKVTRAIDAAKQGAATYPTT